MSKLVGITGFAGAGKDEFAKSLRLRAGFVTFAMSDALHDMALVLNPLLPYEDGQLYEYAQVTAALGYTEAKKIPSYRRYLQVLGTDAVREIISVDVWVWAAERKFMSLLAEGKNVAITGIRYPNESNMIKRCAGINVRIVREGVGPVNQHTSDVSVAELPVDYVVFNNGTLQDLGNQTQEFIRNYGL